MSNLTDLGSVLLKYFGWVVDLWYVFTKNKEVSDLKDEVFELQQNLTQQAEERDKANEIFQQKIETVVVQNQESEQAVQDKPVDVKTRSDFETPPEF